MKLFKQSLLVVAATCLATSQAEAKTDVKQSSSKQRKSEKWDYIIVGAGSAGTPCAWALSNDKKHRCYSWNQEMIILTILLS